MDSVNSRFDQVKVAEKNVKFIVKDPRRSFYFGEVKT